MKVQRRQVSFAKREPISFLWLSGCSLSGRSQQANRSASPAKRYLRWVLHGVPHRGKVYTIMPHIAYIALSLYLTFHQTLPELPPFSSADVQGLDTGKRGTAEPPLQGVALPCRSGCGREVGECSPGLYTASFFLRTDDTGAGMSPDSYGSIYYMQVPLLLTLFYHRNRDCKAAPDFLRQKGCWDQDLYLLTYVTIAVYIYICIYLYTYAIAYLCCYIRIDLWLYGLIHLWGIGMSVYSYWGIYLYIYAYIYVYSYAII